MAGRAEAKYWSDCARPWEDKQAPHTAGVSQNPCRKQGHVVEEDLAPNFLEWGLLAWQDARGLVGGSPLERGRIPGDHGHTGL